MSRIAVFGLGKVGLPMASRLSKLGHEVWGCDTNQNLVRRLRERDNPLPREPHVNLDWHIAADAEEAVERTDWAFIITPTPLVGECLSSIPVVEVISEIANIAARKKTTLPYKVNVVSTLDPRDTHLACRPRDGLAIIYNPPLIRLGQVVGDFADPHIMFLGCDEPEEVRAALMTEVIEIWNAPGARQVRGDVKSVACAKLAINATLSSRGAWGNDVAEKVLSLKADPQVVFTALGAEPRIGGTSYMLPGPPPGGPCLPRDSVVWNNLKPSRLSASIMESHRDNIEGLVSGTMNWLLTRARDGRTLVQSDHRFRVAIFGLGYKPNALDLTNAIGMAIGDAVIEEGMELLCYDPAVKEMVLSARPDWKFVDVREAVFKADCGVICIDYPEVREALTERYAFRTLDISVVGWNRPKGSC